MKYTINNHQSKVNNQNIAIQLTNISKEYTIHHENPTLVEKFVSVKKETFWALKKINLTIYKGDRIGIVGSNGSGKTTLLKIIAGISTPTSGFVQAFGKVASLIDIEAGFQADLTGIQNIYLNGALLGMTKHDINETISKIISFADIKQFIDAPLYTYSNGMKFRLAFAIATASRCDILLMDEIFTAGDIQFQNKISLFIKKIQRLKSFTTIVCSPKPVAVWNYARTFYEINQGQLLSINHKKLTTKIQREAKIWNQTYIKNSQDFKYTRLGSEQ